MRQNLKTRIDKLDKPRQVERVSVQWRLHGEPEPTYTPGAVVVRWGPGDEIFRHVADENGRIPPLPGA